MTHRLSTISIDTILGPMTAIADDEVLYLLEFATKNRLDQEINKLKKQGFILSPGKTKPLLSIEAELSAYFKGELIQFKTPYRLLGTPFQRQVWHALCQIPYGMTKSYAEQATSINRPGAYRAVANANGANQLSIIIPCHRVIASNGTLGGYGGGLPIKQWLIKHEMKIQESELVRNQ